MASLNLPNGISFVRIVSVAEKGTGERDTAKGGTRIIRVPVAAHINNGEGAGFFLKKRDEACGKQLYHSVESWNVMTDDQRKDAMNLEPVADGATAKRVSQFMADFDNTDALTKSTIVDQLAAALNARQPAKGKGAVS